MALTADSFRVYKTKRQTITAGVGTAPSVKITFEETFKGTTDEDAQRHWMGDLYLANNGATKTLVAKGVKIISGPAYPWSTANIRARLDIMYNGVSVANSPWITRTTVDEYGNNILTQKSYVFDPLYVDGQAFVATDVIDLRLTLDAVDANADVQILEEGLFQSN